MTMYAGFRVIDFHLHFPYGPDLMDQWYENFAAKHGPKKVEQLRKNEAEEKAKWRKDNVFDAPVAVDDPDELAARWSQELDKYGIERGVFLTGGGNDVLAAVVKKDSRFLGFAHHSPFAPDAADQLRKAIEQQGLVGYKVIAPLLPKSLDDEQAYPVWEVAEELRIPVLIHIGVFGGNGDLAGLHNSKPLLLHDIAKAFPNVPFIVPHFGAGYPQEFFQLARACPNVYTDTAGSMGWTRWMPYDLSLKHLLRRAMETIGLERVIFGSDSSWFPRGFSVQYLKDLIRDCRALGIKDEEIQMILAGNAERILALRKAE